MRVRTATGKTPLNGAHAPLLYKYRVPLCAHVVAALDSVNYLHVFLHGHIEEAQSMREQQHDANLHHAGRRVRNRAKHSVLATKDPLGRATVVHGHILLLGPGAESASGCAQRIEEGRNFFRPRSLRWLGSGHCALPRSLAGTCDGCPTLDDAEMTAP